MRLRQLAPFAAAALGAIAVLVLVPRQNDQGPSVRADAGAARTAPGPREIAGDANARAPRVEIGAPADAGAAGSDAGPCPTHDYDGALAKGRSLSASKRWVDAIAAYDEAVRARPYDARARAERARAKLMIATDETAIDVTMDLDLARALTRDKALLAQIAHDLGVAFEAAHDKEGARIAFVRAERAGSQPAAKKLGAASRCTVGVERQKPDLALQASWREVLAALGGACDPPDASTEDEARAFACGGCTGRRSPWKRGTCAGGGPWRVETGSLHCSRFGGMIQDLGRGRLLAESGPLDHPPITPLEAVAAGSAIYVRRVPVHYFSRVSGGFVNSDVAYREHEGWTDEIGHGSGSERRCPADERKEVDLELGAGCDAAPGVGLDDGEVRTYYDAAGHFLAAIRLREGDDARVTVRVEEKEARLVVDGGGCALTVPFARAPAP